MARTTEENLQNGRNPIWATNPGYSSSRKTMKILKKSSDNIRSFPKTSDLNPSRSKLRLCHCIWIRLFVCAYVCVRIGFCVRMLTDVEGSLIRQWKEPEELFIYKVPWWMTAKSVSQITMHFVNLCLQECVYAYTELSGKRKAADCWNNVSRILLNLEIHQNPHGTCSMNVYDWNKLRNQLPKTGISRWIPSLKLGGRSGFG